MKWYVPESFTLPRFQLVLFRIMAVMMVFMAGAMILMIHESPMFIFLTLIFLFLAWSMYAYTRLVLTLSDSGITLKGGLRPHDFPWSAIEQADMELLGKYSTPYIMLYYKNTDGSQRKLEISRSYYFKKRFLAIMELLEQQIPREKYTGRYWQLRPQQR
ncbi:hypothetical protein [Chitinophaga vietnamensis]|uniref:hypothetical protein n=1 Tax=Chitinophaga vietnamensis TaxID=2593957 RepID=UPI00117823E1|nr:hypothetical protein [Chitinophaga vietnamensis]